jgi:predicted nucleotidyltransferase
MAVKEEYKRKLIKAIEYHYPEAKIYLFGSWATGKNKPFSDIDLAIDTGQQIPLREIDRIEKTIENLDLHNMVDIVDMNNIPEDLKQNILRDKIVWKD